MLIKMLLFLLSLSIGKSNFNKSEMISVDDKRASKFLSFIKKVDLAVGIYSKKEYKLELKCGTKESYTFKDIDLALKKIETYDCAKNIHIYVAKFYDSIGRDDIDSSEIVFVTEQELNSDILIIEPNFTIKTIVEKLNKRKPRLFLAEEYTPLPFHKIILWGEY